jgi:hypothetical protein
LNFPDPAGGKSATIKLTYKAVLFMLLPLKNKSLSKGNNERMDAKRIRLSSIEIRDDNTFVYHYEAGSFMHRFLADEPLWVRYEGSVKDIPPGIAVIPFLGIISQIIWFYDGTLDIPVLDATYAESMDSIKAVCQAMYPEIHLSGKVNIGKKTSLSPRDYPRKASFFTGGIDSMATALKHRQESPLLIAIWGSEARVHQKKAWHQVSEAQIAAAKEMGLQRTVIASNYLEVLQYWALDAYFPGRMQRSWYVEVAYGSIFLGLSAPLAWREGVGAVYIASSYTAQSGPPDGSYPKLIEKTAWAGTRAVYDGGDEERHTKLERIIAEVRGSFPGLKFNVCTLGKDEGNCNVCERCSRTIAGLALLGIDPSFHGFVVAADTPGRIRQALEKKEWPQAYVWQLSSIKFWREMQEAVPRYRNAMLPEWREFFDWLPGAVVDEYFPKPVWSWREEIKRILKRWLPFSIFVAIRRWKIRRRR